MTTLDLFFDLHTYWHVGTGRGVSAGAHALVHRDASGLPCVPGRQVKGLLRDAVAMALSGHHDPTVVKLFGSAPVKGRSESDEREAELESARYVTQAGALYVTTAHLGETHDETLAWQEWAAHHKGRGPVEGLFRTFSSTRINDKGIAEDNALRTIEVVVPVKLRAEVTGPDDDREWVKILTKSLGFIDAVGGHRTRGFGRATVILKERS